MNQTSDPILNYLRDAIKYIDTTFGEGYAKEHPELVGALIQVVAAEYNAKLTAKILQKGLTDIALAIERTGLTEGK